MADNLLLIRKVVDFDSVLFGWALGWDSDCRDILDSGRVVFWRILDRACGGLKDRRNPNGRLNRITELQALYDE